MKNTYLLALATCLILLFAVTVGCSPKQIPSFPEGVETTCIHGTVWYLSPIDSTQNRYPNATVAAWLHEKDQPIVDTKTDESGNYCIEVPLGNFGVDLRVWGTNHLQRDIYICDGSKDNIDIGTSSKKCGGDCIEIDVIAECRKYIPRRR
jgi:hypothetical protein